MKSDLKSQQQQAGHVLENNQSGQISIRRPSQGLTEAEMLNHGGARGRGGGRGGPTPRVETAPTRGGSTCDVEEDPCRVKSRQQLYICVRKRLPSNVVYLSSSQECDEVR